MKLQVQNGTHAAVLRLPLRLEVTAGQPGLFLTKCSILPFSIQCVGCARLRIAQESNGQNTDQNVSECPLICTKRVTIGYRTIENNRLRMKTDRPGSRKVVALPFALAK